MNNHGLAEANEGDFHLEVTRDHNGIVTGVHPSGGTYSSDVSDFDEEWLRENLWGVVGLATIPGL
jgi:hypothetical protein